MNCQSTFVIYIIECRICRLQYVGKSETAFNLRLNNHRNHIKKGINSCELSEHFLHNSRSHDFSKDVTITIIEQIKRSNMTIERKKEILRAHKCNQSIRTVIPVATNQVTNTSLLRHDKRSLTWWRQTHETRWVWIKFLFVGRRFSSVQVIYIYIYIYIYI